MVRLVLAFTLMVVAACGDDTDAINACVPGESRSCSGNGGCSGFQVCADDGSRLGHCICEGADSAPRPEDASADSDVEQDADQRQDASEQLDAGPDEDSSTDMDAQTETLFDARDFECAVGATEPCETTVPVLDDDERSVLLDDDLDDVTLTFVLSEWVVRRPSDLDGGFNVDGLNSGSGDPEANCVERIADYAASTIDPLHVGIDNALGNFVSTLESTFDVEECPGSTSNGCLDAMALERINTGELLLLIEISGVESMVNDPSVEVALYLGQASGSPMLDVGDRLSADQTFATAATVAPSTRGDIFEGRLRVLLGGLDFPSDPSSPFLVGLDLQSVELRFDLASTAITEGSMGGHASNADVVRALSSTNPDSAPLITQVINDTADIQPMVGDESRCTRSSIAYRFSGVRANRTP